MVCYIQHMFTVHCKTGSKYIVLFWLLPLIECNCNCSLLGQTYKDWGLVHYVYIYIFDWLLIDCYNIYNNQSIYNQSIDNDNQ